MKKTKYNVPFVLKGKPFELSTWTVRKQEEVLKETAKFEDKLPEKELEVKYHNFIILKGLREIDANVTEDDLKDMHPDDKIALFAAVYLQGKRGIIVQEKKDFRKGKNPKQSK